MPDVKASPLNPQTRDRLRGRLEILYGGRDDCDIELILNRLSDLLSTRSASLPDAENRSWDQSDVVLITYGDQVQSDGVAPLAALSEFMVSSGWADLVSTIHVLPFCPYSSDDGFSVIDYYAVDSNLGEWQDLQQIGDRFRLMFDLVLNHCSAQSDWFAAYLRGERPHDRFFVEVDDGADLSAVVRPRSLPLVTDFETANGRRGVWTTFSADQVDLNYAEPDVLLTMLDVLLEYVARGAQIIRLDAVAYLWKQIGTSCIHLPQTHEVVKLMRDILTIAAPHVWLLTETNVPHEENVSYFGEGDEAQMVYQFALPPLLLDAFTSGDGCYFVEWLASLQPPPEGGTFFNFTASHDGVGVRPLEGIVPPERIDALIAAVHQRGGLVSTRRQGDRDVPYELNISYVDALRPDDPDDVTGHARRFLASQAVMLALQGVPAPYFHSLVGTRNDRGAADASGQPRRINRHKYNVDRLQDQLSKHGSLAAEVHQGYRRLLQLRRAQPAFHPHAEQHVLRVENPAVACFVRRCGDPRQTILVAVNFGVAEADVDLQAVDVDFRYDLIAGAPLKEGRRVQLAAGQAVWLSTADDAAAIS